MKWSCLILLLATGCVNPPMVGEFNRIHMDQYIAGKNDCTNKAGRYARILRDNGYEADVLLFGKRGFQDHAIVSVNGFYYDPTWGSVKQGWRLRDWTFIRQVTDAELEGPEYQ